MHKWVLALLLMPALALASIPQIARADDAQGLKDKYKAYMGWSYGDPAVATLSQTRTYTDKNGKLIQAGTEIRQGIIYRRDFQYSTGRSESSGFTGSIFWASHDNGFVTPIVGKTAAYNLAISAFLAGGIAVLPSTLTGTKTIGTTSYDILHVTMNGAAPMDVYEDPSTGAVARVVIDPGGDNEDTFDNIVYTTIGGKHFISSWIYTDHNKDVVTFTNIKPNATIALEQFHPSEPTATWAFNNDKPFPIRVTQKRIYFDATVNGVKGTFILDTGAYSMFLSPQFEARVGATVYSHATASGIGGDVKTDLLRVKTIEVGGNVLSNVDIATSKNDYHEAGDNDHGENADGVFGFPLLGNAVVEVNTSAKTMTIHPPQTPIEGYPGLVVTADLSSSTPVVPMKIDDNIDVYATLDSGNPFQVLFSGDLITKHGLKFLVDRSTLGSVMQGGGVGGTEDEECGNLDSIALGQIVYRPAPACKSPSFSGTDILVGFDFLKNFDFVFDYPAGKIVMNPHQQQ